MEYKNDENEEDVKWLEMHSDEKNGHQEISYGPETINFLAPKLPINVYLRLRPPPAPSDSNRVFSSIINKHKQDYPELTTVLSSQSSIMIRTQAMSYPGGIPS